MVGILGASNLPLLARYLRSPEFAISVANFALIVALWGFEWLNEVEPLMNALTTALPFVGSVNEGIVLSCLMGLLAVFMLPMAWFVLLAAVLEIIEPGNSFYLWVVAWSLPNAVLWGFLVSFLFRLIRTGSIATARGATLRWTTGR